MSGEFAGLLVRLERLIEAAAPRRAVLGIAGPPGAGKTTLVTSLLGAVAAYPRLSGRVAHLPMDGFHLPNAELVRRGLSDRKGAPDTFDAAAYAALLASARSLPRAALTAPSFDHGVGNPVPEAISLPVDADVVVTEGNYLLLDEGEWRGVASLLDEVWWCRLPDPERVERLVSRHVETGRSGVDAREWVMRSDEANARRVAGGKARADLVFVDGVVVAP